MPSKLRETTSVEDDELNVDMSPMIDMVFLLLIFFIVNATAIIVKTDPEVTPPVADQAKAQEDGRGRIVVNVYTDENGSPRFTAEDFYVILENEDAIREYVQKAKEVIDLQGLVPKLHLRGDKDTVFRHSRTAIRAAAAAQVDQVVFAVYVRQP
ncbi:MAG: ExbD/TolR family protein [Luteolibacter sp.]|jgi:biopolymer transport protein ExbD